MIHNKESLFPPLWWLLCKCISSIKLKDYVVFLGSGRVGDFYIFGYWRVSKDENLCSCTEFEWFKLADILVELTILFWCCWGGVRLESQLILDALTIILSLNVGSLALGSGKSSHAMLF